MNTKRIIKLTNVGIFNENSKCYDTIFITMNFVNLASSSSNKKISSENDKDYSSM